MNILILCTGNSARSILGEALINSLGRGTLKGYSAGSTPKGEPHPMALQVLEGHGISTDGYRSKSWGEFEGDGAPHMDIVITVCDSAASETCPIWPGHPCQVHWGLPDPASVEGEGQRAAFEATFTALSERIDRLVALPLRTLTGDALKSALREIHETA